MQMDKEMVLSTSRGVISALNFRSFSAPKIPGPPKRGTSHWGLPSSAPALALGETPAGAPSKGPAGHVVRPCTG